MELKTEMGMNRTGIQMSPIDTKHMLSGTDQELPPFVDGNDSMMSLVRMSYISEADPVGTVPMPGTAKGVVTTGMEKFTGKNPEVFIDKLGERLAFERGGTRLYDALITKCDALTNGSKPMVDMSMLRHFRDQEAAHFELIAQCMEKLGADPTAQTPCADIAGVEAMGLMQVLTDPRTTLAQSLNAILTAELVDNASWELLSKLAEDMGQSEMASSFREALEEENEHLTQVTLWLEQSVLSEAT